MRILRALMLLGLVAAATSCGGGGNDTKQPGLLLLTLNTPNADDGAVLFRVTGGAVDSVAAGAMVQDGAYSTQSTFTRIVLAGDLSDGLLAGVYIPDIADASSYGVVLEQVAVRNTNAQRPLTGYSITVSVP